MPQLLPFSCGPACLIKVLGWNGLEVANDLETQIAIWRTANTVFMGAGPAGCDAIGLVKAAENYGNFMHVVRLQPNFTFASTVRDEVARNVVRAVERQNARYLADTGRLHIVGHAASLESFFENDRPVIVLCSMRGFSSSNEYHWIAKRNPRAGGEIYDPNQGQYEITIRQQFFHDFQNLGIAEFAERHIGSLIDIVN